MDDARKLKEYAQKLYRHIYFRYDELEEIHEMTDETFMTNVELMIQEREQMEERLTAQLAEKDSALAEQASALAEKDSALAEKDSVLADQAARIAELEAQLADYRNQNQ